MHDSLGGKDDYPAIRVAKPTVITMGADAKRKELRRQKFGQMHKAPSSSRGTGKESHLASTTRKLRPDALFPTPESTSQFEGNCQEVETPRDDLKSTPRFICFIG